MGLTCFIFRFLRRPLQDLSQLKGVYPRWQTFMANSAKVFFGTDDYDTAKYVSDSLGQATIEYETQNEGKNSGSGISGGGGSMNRGKSAGSSQQFAGRNLLTPDEVMRLSRNVRLSWLKVNTRTSSPGSITWWMLSMLANPTLTRTTAKGDA
jgi:hypothetical protein